MDARLPETSKPADRKQRRALSVRTRVIAAVMALTAAALTLAGVVIYTHGHAVVEERARTQLQRSIDELEMRAEKGIDPKTAAPFQTPEQLLRVTMQRSVFTSSEGGFAVLDGEIRWKAHDGVTFRPEESASFVASVMPFTIAETVKMGRFAEGGDDWRYAVIPVKFADSQATGAFVAVVDFRAEEALLTSMYTTYALVAAAALLLVGVLIWVLVGRLLAPLSTMSATAARITESDISERIEVHGNDDVTALARTVNGMLDRLEAALGGQRQLLDDVGHELRTPLTIIRGHLELMDASNPVDVTSTRTLVMDELDRMRSLVEDLLTLAKAEQPDFLHPVPIDIARLTDETLAKATGLGNRRWVLSGLADVKGYLDPQRVAQAWLQLAANAVQYSATGSTVTMGSRVVGDSVELWVEDEGVGIPEPERDKVLDRLHRGTSGIGRQGLGLGLSIVASIAGAHGGTVTIEPDRDVGTRIAVVLPLQERVVDQEVDQ